MCLRIPGRLPNVYVFSVFYGRPFFVDRPSAMTIAFLFLLVFVQPPLESINSGEEDCWQEVAPTDRPISQHQANYFSVLLILTR